MFFVVVVWFFLRFFFFSWLCLFVCFLEIFWFPIQKAEKISKVKAERVVCLKTGCTLDFSSSKTLTEEKIFDKRPWQNAKKCHHVTVVIVQSPEGVIVKREHTPASAAGLIIICTFKVL